MTPAGEALAGGAAGALLGGAAASLIGAALPGAVVAGASAAYAGWRGIYDWRTAKGVTAFVLDSTWALPTTAAGLAVHAVVAARGDASYAPELSHRRNRHVYARGVQFRKGFAITVGNVVSGAGDVTNPRRAKLVTDHEDVHVWQTRWLGPLFPLAYAGLSAGGALVGLAAALRGRGPVGRLVETYGYYLNPLEYWAYSRDGHWPPAGIAPGCGPATPAVQSFAALGRTGR